MKRNRGKFEEVNLTDKNYLNCPYLLFMSCSIRYFASLHDFLPSYAGHQRTAGITGTFINTSPQGLNYFYPRCYRLQLPRGVRKMYSSLHTSFLIPLSISASPAGELFFQDEIIIIWALFLNLLKTDFSISRFPAVSWKRKSGGETCPFSVQKLVLDARLPSGSKLFKTQSYSLLR